MPPVVFGDVSSDCAGRDDCTVEPVNLLKRSQPSGQEAVTALVVLVCTVYVTSLLVASFVLRIISDYNHNPHPGCNSI